MAEHAAGTGGIFFLRANSYTISYEYYARTNTEQLRRDGRHGHEGARGGGSGEILGALRGQERTGDTRRSVVESD